ncbi:hypothetical protein M404DRAFT_18121 [Pisolithus tinctorius Marx 270]|uniref:CCHC-type domain-containing protein n=1 Tax=Pisolithus tinctorius Marx 270 TaxID=870435 RepID=A0A0C3KWJ0_PISTI|nr:hypothetical protein M404DRAFT_18121 [Pisolithus tinctorius Marx 270]
MSTAKEVLRSSGGLWKSSKVDSSRASDNHSPHRLYSFCFFCGLSGHIRAGCHSFKSYLALGKCLLVNGCVVLPTGQEIPREVAARTLRDRLDNWSSLASQFETRRGSSLAFTHSRTLSKHSLPTIQLEPLTTHAATVKVAAYPGRIALASSFTFALADSNGFLAPFFLVVILAVLVLALSLILEESPFVRPLQAEAVAQPQSHSPTNATSLVPSAYLARYRAVPLAFWQARTTRRQLSVGTKLVCMRPAVQEIFAFLRIGPFSGSCGRISLVSAPRLSLFGRIVVHDECSMLISGLFG